MERNYTIEEMSKLLKVPQHCFVEAITYPEKFTTNISLTISEEDKQIIKVGNDIQDKYGKDEYYREWAKKIPAIQFPPSWQVQLLGPFGGAMVRFYVNNKISVYLDCNESLGYFGQPYWEIYPYDGDTLRIPMDDIEGLIKGIKQALKEYDE